MRMKSLRGVGVGLSVVFGCLLLALVAELYYLLWWKKKFATNRGDLEVGYNNISSSTSSRIFFCCKKIQSFSRSTQAHQPQSQFQLNSDHQFWNKPFGEESAEAELFRLQNFPGPPRFLFTIKEETKEDLESEDAKSRGERSRKGSRSKSLSDFFHNLETPYMTPVASPQYFTPPFTPATTTAKSTHLNHGFNSFDSASEAEFNFLVRSSPSPKFQFLKDAEEKLHRKQYSQDAEIRRNQEDVFSFEATSTSSMFMEENGRHQSVFHNVLNS